MCIGIISPTDSHVHLCMADIWVKNHSSASGTFVNHSGIYTFAIRLWNVDCDCIENEEPALGYFHQCYSDHVCFRWKHDPLVHYAGVYAKDGDA